jgi:hypothetical protein
VRNIPTKLVTVSLICVDFPEFGREDMLAKLKDLEVLVAQIMALSVLPT